MIHSKVAMGSVGGCVAIIIVWVLKKYVGIDPPDEVIQAFTTLCGFGTGWATKAHPELINLTEQVKP